MNLFKLVLEVLLKKGGAALWTWIGLMLATWLAAAFARSSYQSGEKAMSVQELLGAGLCYGLLVLAGFAIATKLRRRRDALSAGSHP